MACLLEFDQKDRPSAFDLLDHEFMKKATTRKRMEKVLSNIFLQGIVRNTSIFAFICDFLCPLPFPFKAMADGAQEETFFI